MEELTFNASDNVFVLESPSMLSLERNSRWKQQLSAHHKLTLRLNEVRDELVFNASDNNDIPEGPAMLLFEWKRDD